MKSREPNEWILIPLGFLGSVLVIISALALMRPQWFLGLSPVVRILIVILGLFSWLAFIFILRGLLKNNRERLKLENCVGSIERSVSEAYERLEAIFQVNQKFVDASDENDVVAPVLSLIVDLIGAQGAAFVPLDQHGQPQAMLSHGEVPDPATSNWVESLTSPGVRERCGQCENYDLVFKPDNCPLLTGPFAQAGELLCLAVKRGEREFGVLSIFLFKDNSLDERTRTFLRALIEEMALGLDSVRMRRNELSALRDMQRIRQKSDLQALLNNLLENLHNSLDGDLTILNFLASNIFPAGVHLTIGNVEGHSRSLTDGIIQGVILSAEPVLLGDVSGDPTSGLDIHSLIAVPLLSSDRQVVGGALVGKRRVGSFTQRQLALFQTIAGQVALVFQNASLMAELEYKTMIQERTRLAREIHDGMAQTLGFLKLQVAQMRKQSAQGENEKLMHNLDSIYTALSEAYEDARQSIDGLRITPDTDDLAGWLYQTVQEFEELSGITVSTQITSRSKLPVEVHAQLVRILQEALFNIRKHANASLVWVDFHEIDGDLVLEVRDDGIGFLPEDVSPSSRYGLQGMRERSDLIGADFQVESKSQGGTIIRIRMPIEDVEGYRL